VVYFYSHQISPSPFNLRPFSAHEHRPKGADTWGCLCIIFLWVVAILLCMSQFRWCLLSQCGSQAVEWQNLLSCLSLWIVMTNLIMKVCTFVLIFFVCA
jgi:hypothetical protein